MKTKILSLAILSLWSITSVFAQDRTTVTATNSDISDNLDLRAVASIFGDSRDLDDFERRLNDPKAQISNLDLNGDNQVDYLRVIETVEGNAHLIVIQAVLGADTYQDIATVEVERDHNNQVQVQVVGDVYMYGDNYIYEPVYSYTPVIYTSFWVGNYRPYYSSWYWGYYPHFYVAWSPFPVYTYHTHIGGFINHHNHYNYVNVRRNTAFYNSYYNGRRQNAYERQYPNRSFVQRNSGYSNRRELVGSRTPQVSNTRGNSNVLNPRSATTTGNTPRSVRNVNGSNEINNTSTPRSNGSIRNTQPPRSVTVENGATRDVTAPRSNSNTGNSASSPRTYGGGTNTGTRTNGSFQGTSTPRTAAPQAGTRTYEAPRNAAPRNDAPRNDAPRNIQRSEAPRNMSQPQAAPQQRASAPRSEGNAHGGRR